MNWKTSRRALATRRKATPVDEFALERGEKALTHSVVVCIAHRAHRLRDARLAAMLPERQGRVLRALSE